jgi:hypothetical protein
VRYRTGTNYLLYRSGGTMWELQMDRTDVAAELRAVIAELDQVRLSLMADAPRRRTYLQLVKTIADAQQLLAEIESENYGYPFAAE